MTDTVKIGDDALDDVCRLAGDLDRFLDRLLGEIHASHLSSTDCDRPRLRRARAVRRGRLQHYVGTMSTAQRLRLAAALHLLSSRLDDELAQPERRGDPARGLTPASDRRTERADELIPKLGEPNG